MILRINAGPTNWLSILKGFNDSDILPIGGGKYGVWLGSCLAIPIGLASAQCLGSTVSEILAIPLQPNSSVLGLIPVRGIQKDSSS